ncbi:MAG: hypothetical protein R2795_27160 [Saprospiraceae bacterium]
MNIIEDWETKLEGIVNETLQADMRLISGIPPWVQMYYERLLERTGKRYVKDIFLIMLPLSMAVSVLNLTAPRWKT